MKDWIVVVKMGGNWRETQVQAKDYYHARKTAEHLYGKDSIVSIRPAD